MINQVELEQKRASLLSVRKFSHLRNDVEEDQLPPPPEDKFHLLHVVFFILGMGAMLPMSFFLTANDYWMYKFREINGTLEDTGTKTTLQKNFLSTSSVIGSVSSIATNVISSMFAHKLTLRFRFVGTMGITVTFFLLYTILVEVNTDSWQLGFFILTMGIFFLNNIACSLFMMSNMAMMSRFPPIYMKTNMYGSSLGMLMGSVVQIICLTIGGSSTQVALIYFLIGTIACAVTLAAAFYIHYIPRFHHFLGDAVADTKKPMPSFRVIMEVSKNVWPLLLSGFISNIAMTMSGPSITVLIVPENHFKGDLWTDKYFVPVIIFLLPGITGLIGRVFATPWLNKSNVYLWLTISIIESVGISPLFLFCNLNQNHLPILFHKDWQFITLMCVHTISGSYLTTVSLLSMIKFAGDKMELTFLVQATLMGIFMQATSPLSSIWVNIL